MPIHENEERALLSALAGGSEYAFSTLFHLYKDKLYSFIFRISGSSQLAEDTVQDVFMKIWQRRSEAATINKFDAYLFRSARNHALNAIKKMARETAITTAQAPEDIDSSHTYSRLESKELEAFVQQAVDRLSKKQKRVFNLSREKGLKHAEISRALNISVPTVKSHITQAMHFIRKECKNFYPVIKLLIIVMAPWLP